MPKYELMYVIGGATSDDEIPQIIEEIKKAVEKADGKIDKHEDLGKKKLAYQIKHSKTGHYVLVNFDAQADKCNEIEHMIQTNQNIIRHLLVNIDEALVRMEKDRVAQAKANITNPTEESVEKKPEPPTEPARRSKKIDIDLDAEIEKAIEPEDLK